MAEGNREQALALKDLLLLSLYTLFPPSRALEVRTLKIFLESSDQQFNINDEGNFIVFKADGRRILLFYNNYKTCKKYGRDITWIEVFTINLTLKPDPISGVTPISFCLPSFVAGDFVLNIRHSTTTTILI